MHSSSVCMMAPVPVFTSSTMPLAPAAIFLDMMEDAISGMLSTVLVTSRSAYSRLSAGASWSLWDTTQQPTARTMDRNSSSGSSTRMPGMASILSMVPPVWPRPRPLILTTLAPQAAASGTRTSHGHRQRCGFPRVHAV